MKRMLSFFMLMAFSVSASAGYIGSSTYTVGGETFNITKVRASDGSIQEWLLAAYDRNSLTTSIDAWTSLSPELGDGWAVATTAQVNDLLRLLTLVETDMTDDMPSWYSVANEAAGAFISQVISMSVANELNSLGATYSDLIYYGDDGEGVLLAEYIGDSYGVGFLDEDGVNDLLLTYVVLGFGQRVAGVKVSEPGMIGIIGLACLMLGAASVRRKNKSKEESASLQVAV